MSAEDRLSLAALGRELDAARRGRSDYALEETDSLTPLSSPMATRRSLSTSSSDSEASVPERPYPLCLLCLSRPPTAVLLPCCHLNLCHICAPALLVRHRCPAPSRSPAITSPRPAVGLAESPNGPRDERPSWNTLLARATANHPKSRRLSMGGYIAPKVGTCGGEMTAECLLPEGMTNDARTGMTGALDQSGRLELAVSEGSGTSTSTSTSAKCLMCRAGVKGWLRVYSG